VGLKQTAIESGGGAPFAFSRTPRGFEATSSSTMLATPTLSAEPLVGLKLQVVVVSRPVECAFQPNPSWV